MSQEITEETELPPAEPALLDHEYDGIQEFDNPTPGWWVMLFILTVVFAGFYTAFYFAPIESRSIYAAYDSDKAENDAQEMALLGDLGSDETSLLSYMQNPKYVGIGRAIFKSSCVSCHGADGQGLVGPNLTDNKYKNVKQLTDLTQVISNGANNGAMPGWAKGSNALKPSQIVVVAAYVASLRGQNLTGPGVAGDVEIPAWPQPAATSPVSTSPTTPATK